MHCKVIYRKEGIKEMLLPRNFCFQKADCCSPAAGVTHAAELRGQAHFAQQCGGPAPSNGQNPAGSTPCVTAVLLQEKPPAQGLEGGDRGNVNCYTKGADQQT